MTKPVGRIFAAKQPPSAIWAVLCVVCCGKIATIARQSGDSAWWQCSISYLTIVQISITKAQLQQLQSADLPVTVVVCLAQQLVRQHRPAMQWSNHVGPHCVYHCICDAA